MVATNWRGCEKTCSQQASLAARKMKTIQVMMKHWDVRREEESTL